MPKKSVKKENAKEGLGGLIAALAKSIKETAHYQTGEQIKYPIEVGTVNTFGKLGFSHRWGTEPGSMVMIRPVEDKKTYLGVYLGDVPLSVHHAYDPKKHDLNFYISSNPAIFVPNLNKVVLGAESWWGPINSEKELFQISDADIQNIWYVKALKQIQEAEAKKTATA